MTKPDETKEKEKDKLAVQIFTIAEKYGVKADMIQLIKDCINMHKDVMPASERKFGPEELFFSLEMGLSDAGTPDNFLYRNYLILGKAYLFGYFLGRNIMKEAEKKAGENTDVGTVNQS